MAEFRTTSTAGFDLSIYDLTDLDTIKLVQKSSTQLQWNNGTEVVTLTGTDFVVTVSHGLVTGISGGTVTGLSIATGGIEVTATGMVMSASSFYATVLADDWAAGQALITRQDDQFYGTNRADVLRGGQEIDYLTGFGGNDVLDGGMNDDTLIGGGGHDTLTGGFNVDAFIFGEKPAASSSDVITDFQHGIDTILLENVFYKGLGAPGDLDPTRYYVGSAAINAKQHIIYDPTNGHLMYDKDGNGAAAAIVIATLTNLVALSSDDIGVF